VLSTWTSFLFNFETFFLHFIPPFRDGRLFSAFPLFSQGSHSPNRCISPCPEMSCAVFRIDAGKEPPIGPLPPPFSCVLFFPQLATLPPPCHPANLSSPFSGFRCSNHLVQPCPFFYSPLTTEYDEFPAFHPPWGRIFNPAPLLF